VKQSSKSSSEEESTY